MTDLLQEGVRYPDVKPLEYSKLNTKLAVVDDIERPSNIVMNEYCMQVRRPPEACNCEDIHKL